MLPLKPSKRIRRAAIAVIAVALVLSLLLILFVNRFVEPILRDRLHTLIVQGSDSLYRYQLGDLNAHFFGGNVEVENLQISIDSSRYRQLAAQNSLPALTMQLDLAKGYVKGIGVFALLFDKKINVREIMSKDADIKLLRHILPQEKPKNVRPLWQAIQPAINSISIGRIKLDGVKLLYRNADTAQSVKLQFDKCIALFSDIRIDSAATEDTGRIAFTKEISMDFYDLKFRSPDSTYKLKAEAISYSSKNKTLEISDFKLQPTLKDKESFYHAVGQQQAMNIIEFDKVRFTNLHLEKYFHNNIVIADTVYINGLQTNIYMDKTYPPTMQSKIGRYPHQNLLKAKSAIMIKGVVINNAAVTYTEKAEKTGEEGLLTLNDVTIRINNLTNDSNLIRQNNICSAVLQGNLLGKSPIMASFRFYLDSMNGRFDASGSIKNVNAEQLNALAEPLANTRLQSFNMRQLQFFIRGDDFSAIGDVRMLYDQLFVVLRKTDEETGATRTKRFLTKLVNKYTLHDSNPGPNGERVARNARRARISYQSFFGLIWKTIFTGMQDIMMNTGRYE